MTVEIGEDEKVFGPDGFGTVLISKPEDRIALVEIVHPEERFVERYEFDELELIDEREWVVYEEGPVETPYR